MLRFMDWSVVAMGILLVLGSLGSRWRERPLAAQGQGPDQGMRSLRTWLPLLMGLGMIGAKVPGLLHAPHPVVVYLDALDFALAVTVAVMVVLRPPVGRRFHRRRGTM